MTIRRMAATLGIIAIALAGRTSEDGGFAGVWVGGGESDCSVAVSWNNFQQPRWAAKDKPEHPGDGRGGWRHLHRTPTRTSTPSSS